MLSSVSKYQNSFFRTTGNSALYDIQYSTFRTVYYIYINLFSQKKVLFKL